MRLTELAQLLGAQIIRGDPELVVRRFSTDTRTVQSGDCFIALQGPNFDGHEFLNVAAERGASAAVVSHPTRASNSPSVLALLQVPDTLTALHKLATNYRRLMPLSTRVVAVTGSSGKTTTKEMIAAVLGQRFNVVKTEGNMNNHIGLPLNLLRLDEKTDFGVFELGTNHPGEIRALAELAQPNVGVITNIGLAHAEFLGDEEGVMREKASLLSALPASGFAVLNVDDKWLPEMRARMRGSVVRIGIENFADVRATDIQLNGCVKFRLHLAKKREEVTVRLQTLGRHQVYNALEAAAVGNIFGMSLDEIREGLENVEFPHLRMEIIERAGIRYVNDCYNANVPSMRAALQTLRETATDGRKIAVLGDMLELGAHAQAAHLDVGACAANTGCELLITVGQSARWIAEGATEAGMERHKVFPAISAGEAAEALNSLAREGDTVLIKGSRRVGLERILETK